MSDPRRRRQWTTMIDGPEAAGRWRGLRPPGTASQSRRSGLRGRSPGHLERLGGVGGKVSGADRGSIKGCRGRCLQAGTDGVLDVAGGDHHVEQRQQHLELRLRSLSRVVPKISVRRGGGKHVASVSARATAEAALCAPSITSQGLRPTTSTRAGHRSAANPRTTSSRLTVRLGSTSARTSRPASATAALWAWCGPSSGKLIVPSRSARSAPRQDTAWVESKEARVR